MKDKEFIEKCRRNRVFENQEKISYCKYCKSDVEVKIIKGQMEAIYKDKKYIYKYQSAVCRKCKNHIFFKQVDDYNNNEINKVHKKVCRDNRNLQLSI